MVWPFVDSRGSIWWRLTLVDPSCHPLSQASGHVRFEWSMFEPLEPTRSRYLLQRWTTWIGEGPTPPNSHHLNRQRAKPSNPNANLLQRLPPSRPDSPSPGPSQAANRRSTMRRAPTCRDPTRARPRARRRPQPGARRPVAVKGAVKPGSRPRRRGSGPPGRTAEPSPRRGPNCPVPPRTSRQEGTPFKVPLGCPMGTQH